MFKKGPKSSFVKISEASNILGVHKDTIRRWEKSGKLKTERSKKGTRLFDLAELEKLKSQPQIRLSFEQTTAKQRPVTISQAAQILRVHKDTLRRWERSGKVHSDRGVSGHRLYHIDQLQEIKPMVSAKAAVSTEHLLDLVKTQPPYQSLPQSVPIYVQQADQNVSEYYKYTHRNLKLLAGFISLILTVSFGVAAFTTFSPKFQTPADKMVIQESKVLGATSFKPLIKINADTKITGTLNVNGLVSEMYEPNAGFGFSGNDVELKVTKSATIDQDLSRSSSPTFAGLTVNSPINAPQATTGNMTLTSSKDQIVFDISGTKSTLSWAPTAARTITLPDSTDTLVGKTTTDTLSNKTIKSGDSNTISGSYPDITGITSLGTVATGTWNGTKIGAGYGGTGLTTYTTGDVIYSSASNTLSKLAIGTDGQVLKVSSGIPAWGSSSVDLGGSSATGTLTVGKGGTSITTYTTGDMLYASATDTLSKLSVGSSGQVLSISSGAPAWTTVSYESPLTFGSSFSRTSNTISLASNLGIGASFVNAILPSNGLAVSGNVGIGTTSPSAALDVVGNAKVSGTLTVSGSLISNGSQSGYFQRNSGMIAPNTITDSLGIGTSSPTANLQVAGTTIINPSADNSTALTLRAAPSGTANILTITNSDSSSTYFSINSSGQLSGSALKITDVNNAIVGTAIPGGWTNVVLHGDSTAHAFSYERQVTVSNSSGSTLPSNYEITINTSSLNAANASQVYSNTSNTSSPYKDFRLAYYDGSTYYNEIPIEISSFTSSNITLKFQLQAAINNGSSDAKYYLFYGNSSYSSLPTPWTYTAGNTQIDALENIGVGTTNWTSSDIQFPLGVATSNPTPQEGSGALQVSGTVDNMGAFASTGQWQLPAALTNFGFTTANISGTEYLYEVGGSTTANASAAQNILYYTSVNSSTGNIGIGNSNSTSLPDARMDNATTTIVPAVAGGDGTDGSVDLTNGGGAGGCTGTGLTWTAGTSTCTIATATKRTFNFTSLNIPSGTTLTTDGPKTSSNFLTINATGNIGIGGTINLTGKGYCGAYNSSPCTYTTAYGPGAGSGGATGSGIYGGGGGGGFGGTGGRGGTSKGGAGGSTYDTLDSGSGGGRGNGTITTTASGNGGGGINLSSSGTTTISGNIWADGSNGFTTTHGNGGGSGGKILIVSTTLTVQSGATLSANGGNGGDSTGTSIDGAGGGGGGGRITLQSNTISNSGTVTVTAGAKGSGTGSAGIAGNTGVSTQVAASNPYFYVLGGKDSSGNTQSTIYKATLSNADGSVGVGVTDATSLPQALYGHGIASETIGSNPYVYVIGGNNGTTDQKTVYKFSPDNGGNIGVGSTASQTQLTTGISYPAVTTATINSTNYLYVAGGLNGSTAQTSVYKGTFDGSGNLTLTTTGQASLPQGLYAESAVVATVGSNNYMYVYGGKDSTNTPQTTVYKAPMDSSGNVTGPFTTTGQTQLTTGIANFGAFNFTDGSSNQYAYIIGGNTGTVQSAVTRAKYTPIDQTATPYKITRSNFSSTDLSKYNDLTFYVNSSLTGTYLAMEVYDGTTWQPCYISASTNFSISSANTWEQKDCDLTNASSSLSTNRTGITGIRFKVTSSQSSAWTANFDNIQAERNHTTISNSLSAGSSILGAASLAVNAQGTGLVQINYSNPNANPATSQAGTGGLAVYNGSATALLAVDSTGNVGIGFSNALTKLAVSGNVNIGYTGAMSDPLGLSIRGNVGIGTTSPTAPIFVWGNGINSGIFLNGNIGIGITSPGAGLSISTNEVIGYTGVNIAGPANGLAISGNLGIGATTASSKLYINGGASIGSSYNITAPTNGLIVQGNVGIGVSAPSYHLDVAGGARFVCGNSTWNSGPVTTCSDVAEVYESDGNVEVGEIVAVGTTVIPSAAEGSQDSKSRDSLPSAQNDKRDLVTRSITPYQQNIIGVYSTSPGLLVGGETVLGTNAKLDGNKIPVALAGRVPIKVSTESGVIKAGDYLTSSSTPGVAMKAVRPGQVIGKALEDYSGVEISKILAFVNITFADPNNFLASLSLDPDGNLIAPKIKTDKILVSGNIGLSTTNPSSLLSYELTQTANSTPGVGSDSLGVSASVNVMASLKNLDQAVLDVASKQATQSSVIASQSEAISELKDKLASLSAVIAANQTKQSSSSAEIAGVTSSSASESATPSSSLASNCLLSIVHCPLNLTPPDILLASSSANLKTLAVESEATVSGMLTTYEAQIQDHFKVLGNTVLAKTTINGDLTMDGTFSISGNSVNGLPILYLQDSSLAKEVNLFNGLVTINNKGQISAVKVQTDKLILGSQVLGESKINSGSIETIIQTPGITDKSKVFITPQADIDTPLFVTEKIAGQSFKVKIKQATGSDIIFDWQIIDSP